MEKNKVKTRLGSDQENKGYRRVQWDTLGYKYSTVQNSSEAKLVSVWATS